MNWEKTILFGFGNGAEFRPQILEIESPGVLPRVVTLYHTEYASGHLCIELLMNKTGRVIMEINGPVYLVKPPSLLSNSPEFKPHL